MSEDSESEDDSPTDLPPSPTEQHRVMPRKRPIVSDEDYLHRQLLKMIKTQLQDNRDHRERLQNCMDELYRTRRVGPLTITLDSSSSSDEEEEGEAYVPSSHNSDELDGGDECYGGEGSEVNRWDSDMTLRTMTRRRARK